MDYDKEDRLKEKIKTMREATQRIMVEFEKVVNEESQDMRRIRYYDASKIYEKEIWK